MPATYFLITFTLPAELRSLAWRHQREVYALLMQCAWDTLDTFCRNDPKLGATAGAVGVLHTNNRRLDFHPHVHMVMPAAALDTRKGLWRTKSRRARVRACRSGGKNNARAGSIGTSGTATGTAPTRGAYLFSHRALAKVFRAKLLDALEAAGLTLPTRLPDAWIVHCKAVGDGRKALLYLGRYLYRGVIQESDILRCEDGRVSFRYRDAKTDKAAVRTLDGADFLWLVLQHVLPKGLRRARNFGFLHPNSAQAIRLLQVLHLRAPPATVSTGAALSSRPAWRCACGHPMRVVCRRMPPSQPPGSMTGATQTGKPPDPPTQANTTH